MVGMARAMRTTRMPELGYFSPCVSPDQLTGPNCKQQLNVNKEPEHMAAKRQRVKKHREDDRDGMYREKPGEDDADVPSPLARLYSLLLAHFRSFPPCGRRRCSYLMPGFRHRD